MFVLTKHELYIVKSELLLAYKREKLSVDNMKQAPPEKLAKPVSIVTTWGNFRYTRRNENGRVVTIGPDALRYLSCLFRKFSRDPSSQGFSKSGNPDVLKLFHRHSVWITRMC